MAVLAFSSKMKICDSTSVSSFFFKSSLSFCKVSISILDLTTSGWHSSCTLSCSFSLMAAPPCSSQNSAGARGSWLCFWSLSRFCSLSLTTSFVALSEVSSFLVRPWRAPTWLASFSLSEAWAALSEERSFLIFSKWFLDSSSRFWTTFPSVIIWGPSAWSLRSSAFTLVSSVCKAAVLPIVSSQSLEVFFTVLALWASLRVLRVSSRAAKDGDTLATKLHFDMPPKEFLRRKVSLLSL